MNKDKRLYTSIALVAITGILVILSYKKKKEKKTRNRLHQVSEEGYETAHDVLFPLKIKRLRSDRTAQ